MESEESQEQIQHLFEGFFASVRSVIEELGHRGRGPRAAFAPVGLDAVDALLTGGFLEEVPVLWQAAVSRQDDGPGTRLFRSEMEIVVVQVDKWSAPGRQRDEAVGRPGHRKSDFAVGKQLAGTCKTVVASLLDILRGILSEKWRVVLEGLKEILEILGEAAGALAAG